MPRSRYAYDVISATSDSASEFSRRVVANVASLRTEQGISNTALQIATGRSRNYYYMRMRGEAAFDLNDISLLAAALGVDPSRLTSNPLGSSDREVRLPGVELSRRVRLLNSGEESMPIGIAPHLEGAGIKDPVSFWTDLMAGSTPVSPEAAMREITAFFDAPPAYLFEPASSPIVDRVEAEFELQAALKMSGASALAARALGEVTPAALRAIAQAIRPDQTQPTGNGTATSG